MMRPVDILAILVLDGAAPAAATTTPERCTLTSSLGGRWSCVSAAKVQHHVDVSDNSRWLTIVAQMYASTRYILTPDQAKKMYSKLLTNEYSGDEERLRNDCQDKIASCNSDLLSSLSLYIPRISSDKTTSATRSLYKDALSPHVHQRRYSDADTRTFSRHIVTFHNMDKNSEQGTTAAIELKSTAHTMANSVSTAPNKVYRQTVNSDGEPHVSVSAAVNSHQGDATLADRSSRHLETDNTNLIAAWIQSLDPAQRAWIQNLRYNTPLRADVLRGLLQQFFCVENADVFFAPVPAATIMEFNGMRLASYHHVVRAPMSLMVINKLIGESWRRYRNSGSADHTSFLARPTTPLHTKHSTKHHSAAEGNAVYTQPFDHSLCSSSSASSDWDFGSTEGSMHDTITAHALPLSDFSSIERIITLAELERSLWLIAANCVMFNAPETTYPNTARRFAIACTRILVDYCARELHLSQSKA